MQFISNNNYCFSSVCACLWAIVVLLSVTASAKYFKKCGKKIHVHFLRREYQTTKRNYLVFLKNNILHKINKIVFGFLLYPKLGRENQ